MLHNKEGFTLWHYCVAQTHSCSILIFLDGLFSIFCKKPSDYFAWCSIPGTLCKPLECHYDLICSFLKIFLWLKKTRNIKFTIFTNY